jgi:cytochrome c-type biogenesis protein CcmH/NrfG
MDRTISRSEVEADAAAGAGRLADARRLLEAAVRETPTRLETWLKLSAMARAAGDIDEALAAVSRALAIAPLDLPRC